MSTLDCAKLDERKRKKRNIFIFCSVIIIIISPLAVEGINGILAGLITHFGNFQFDFNYFSCLKKLVTQKNRAILFLLYIVGILVTYLYESSRASPELGETSMMEVAHGIWIPVPVGNGQCGSARFQTEDEKRNTYSVFEYSGKINQQNLPQNSGIVIEQTKEGKKEIIKYLSIAAHAIIIAATRRGKTRRVFLPTVWLNILASVNMCITDCKGEIYLFTHLFAKLMGYTEITFDLRNPELSMMHNYMQEIVDYLKEEEMSEATEKTWDLVSVLVGEAKGEKIWNDGECSSIAAAILLVAQDAPDECKNLTNVYYFLAYMCEPDPETGEVPMNTYLERLPDNHPAKAVFQVAKIAPYRTRSSFFTSALGTLRLFTDWKIADMTSKSEYDLKKIDEQKTIIYIIIPDDKRTRYPLGSLYINQVYVNLIDIASQNGGQVNHRFEFLLDEFGNFPTIPGMGSMMSAGAGRNIFFRLVLQDFQQLKKNYPEDFHNIKTNADVTVYLGSTDLETTKELSEKLDSYTIETKTAGTSANDGRKREGVNYSSGANMSSRPLLYPGEIKGIKAPDALVLNGAEHPAIMNLPDVSKYYANDDFGMGDEEFNKQLLMERTQERRAREVVEPVLWGVWNQIKEDMRNEMIERALLEQAEKSRKKEEKDKKKNNTADEKVSFMN